MMVDMVVVVLWWRKNSGSQNSESLKNLKSQNFFRENDFPG